MVLEALAMFGLILTSAILMRWRLGILVLFLVIILEGAFRKWMFPSLQEYIYFVKDGVLLLTAVGFLLDRRVPRRLSLPAGYAVLLVAYTLWVLGEIANPRL